MTIVHATVDDLFAELKMKKIQEARLEAVATITRDKRNVRIVSFSLHVTTEINGLLAQVVIPYHKEVKELVDQQMDVIEEKRENLIAKCKELAVKHSIKLLQGAFWEGKPFTGHVENQSYQQAKGNSNDCFVLPF